MSHFEPILKINVDIGADEVKVASERVATANMMIISGIAGALIAGIGLALVISRDVSRAMGQFLAALDPISRGDLTQSINTSRTDEFGVMATRLHAAIESMRETIAGVSMTSQSVAAAATQIAASAEEMSQTLKTQEREATQVSAAVSEMSASVVEVARKSSDAAGNAKDSGEQAAVGGEIVRRTVGEMNTIDSEVTNAAGAVEDLAARSDTIGKVIGVINDIAEQTNLLALNAAIEAARAGEHGRGFAVVADEVRKLAERTTTATKEVGETIKSIQVGTRDAVEKIKACTTRVQDGVKLAGQAGSALDKIVQGSGGVQTMVASIAAAAEEQSAAADQVARSIQSITASSQESSQAASQAAEAAANLSQQSETLRELILRFKV
jgi:methyl-accepting chemotaxis protein